MNTVVYVKPIALTREDAAAYTSLSEAAIKELENDPKSGFPQRVQLTKRRVAYLTVEIDEWVMKQKNERKADNLPPAGSGYGRKGKAGAEQAKA